MSILTGTFTVTKNDYSKNTIDGLYTINNSHTHKIYHGDIVNWILETDKTATIVNLKDKTSNLRTAQIPVIIDINALKRYGYTKNNVPIYVGGFSEPALKRAARHDGWISDMHSLEELEALIKKVNLKRSDFPEKENYEYICFTCWDAFSKGGFKKMKSIGVTTMTTYPWMLYGIMNDAPLEQKIEGMHKFYNEIIHELKD